MITATVVEGGRGHGPAAEHRVPPVLVVGVDGSPASWDAFSWAAGRAQRNRARVIAVFAVPLVDPELAMAFNVPLDYVPAEDAKNETADELEREVVRRAGGLGVEASFVREHGDAAQALARVAGRAHADVIVVGRSVKALRHLGGSFVPGGDLPPVVVVP
jgi:nucleotide-binding universal stress UspA family protein